ncbi:hypothetical protein QJS66_08995 [Kocuria rhizophila]|nr:hypothetical protein QJS66_08995 [Kocuria rhizophila]
MVGPPPTTSPRTSTSRSSRRDSVDHAHTPRILLAVSGTPRHRRCPGGEVARGGPGGGLRQPHHRASLTRPARPERPPPATRTTPLPAEVGGVVAQRRCRSGAGRRSLHLEDLRGPAARSPRGC